MKSEWTLNDFTKTYASRLKSTKSQLGLFWLSEDGSRVIQCWLEVYLRSYFHLPDDSIFKYGYW